MSDRCFAHLSLSAREAYLDTLNPGADISHRGTAFTVDLLNALTNALWATNRQCVIVGHASFTEARFIGDAGFYGAQFTGDIWFTEAEFNGDADFAEARFSGDAEFTGATFARTARFSTAKFTGPASFDGATFTGTAAFDSARFNDVATFSGASFTNVAAFTDAEFGGIAWFSGARFIDAAVFSDAQFTDVAWFGGTHFTGDATFNHAQFAGDSAFGQAQFAGGAEFGGAQFDKGGRWGPIACAQTVTLNEARFAEPITMEIEATDLNCTRTTWAGTATLRVRHAWVDLTDAVLTAPVAVTAHPTPFIPRRSDDADCSGVDVNISVVRIMSVRGVDTAHLTLTNVALDGCQFIGAFHLDQLSLGGQIAFAQPPTGWHRHGPLPARWSRRRTLAEERQWRQRTGAHGWRPRSDAHSTPSGRPPIPPPEPAPAPQPDELAGTYRALRQALESRGNAPGAADFYYGEMEMRRHDLTNTRVERAILAAYWLLSGYGLRASRALIALLLIMTATVLAILLIGLPSTTPEPVATGTAQPGGQITLHTTTPGAVLPPWAQRMSDDRLATTVPVVLDAVIFRAADTNLTPAGIYLDMFARLAEPSLLALAVLAIRGRVKR
jgi:hypothetical protein